MTTKKIYFQYYSGNPGETDWEILDVPIDITDAKLDEMAHDGGRSTWLMYGCDDDEDDYGDYYGTWEPYDETEHGPTERVLIW